MVQRESSDGQIKAAAHVTAGLRLLRRQSYILPLKISLKINTWGFFFVLFCRNLKKCEESIARVQGELEENEKLKAELTEQLKKLEDEAGEIMKACHEAEVSASYLRFNSVL